MNAKINTLFVLSMLFLGLGCAGKSDLFNPDYVYTSPLCRKVPVPKKRLLRSTRNKKKQCHCYKPAIDDFFKGIIKDVFALNLNVLAWDSFKVIASIFPFYISTRMIDDKLHRCFYDELCHKNRTQLPPWCHTVAKFSLAIPIIILGSEAFFSRDYEHQQTARMLLLGMPFVIFAKDLIKKFEFDACLRPWNEHFSCVRRAHGGFPSGHMAEATYVAVLYGMRFGPSYAIPLGILAAFIGVSFLNCNRHYLSQLVAGAGFGALYALAAQKVIDKKISDRLHISLGISAQKATGIVSYRF